MSAGYAEHTLDKQVHTLSTWAAKRNDRRQGRRWRRLQSSDDGVLTGAHRSATQVCMGDTGFVECTIQMIDALSQKSWVLALLSWRKEAELSKVDTRDVGSLETLY